MSTLLRQLSETEKENFLKSKARDKKIVPVLIKLLTSKLTDLDRPASEKDLESPSWALARAHRDGGRHYLKLFLTLLEEKE